MMLLSNKMWKFAVINVVIVTVCGIVIPNTTYSNDEIESLFLNFVRKHGKPYANNTNEYMKRLAIFQNNHKNAVKLNLQRQDNASAWYGITKFSDLTLEEFTDSYLSEYKTKNQPTTDLPLYNQNDSNVFNNELLYQRIRTIPKRVDWREKGIITAVKNQHICGGCWAFTAIENIESIYTKRTKHQKRLSIQEVMDCSSTYMGILNGCSGGQPCLALHWLIQSKTILLTEKQYPLKNKDQYCKLVPKTASGVKLTKAQCANLVGKEQLLLLELATNGPVAVAVDAANWFNYLGGIIQYNCPSHLNHAVQIVGYDLTGPVPYYIVRNSWGKDWGVDGYLALKFGVNICGMATEVSWVTDIDIII